MPQGQWRITNYLLFMNFHFNLVLKNLMSACHWVDSNLLHITGIGHIFRTQLRIVSFFSSSTKNCYYRFAFIVQKIEYVEKMLTMILLRNVKKWSMLQKMCYYEFEGWHSKVNLSSSDTKFGVNGLLLMSSTIRECWCSSFAK